MKLVTAELRARNLMKKNGLKDWDFQFDRGTRRLGATWPHSHKITLSKKFVELNKWVEVKETILHEIAHALTREAHTNRWRLQYINLGGNPDRNYAELVSPTIAASKWIGTCPSCKYTVYSRARRSSACAACCKKYNNNRFTLEYKFEWKER